MTVYINGVPQGNGNGVSQAEFDAHTHNYRKPTKLGVDANRQFNSVVRVDITDDAEVHVEDGTDLESVAITVSTQPTGTPN